MRTIRWYNPKSRTEEEVLAPLSEAQAIEMLSGHPNSDEFIEEYRRKRITSGIVEALTSTGEFFYWEELRSNPPSSSRRRRKKKRASIHQQPRRGLLENRG